MAELLLELISEDIPPAMQEPASENLARLFAERLKAENCDAHLTAKFSTPKRIGICFDGLPKKIPEKKETRRGPKLTAPQKAIDGFKKSLSGAKANITKQDGYYFAEISHPAANMADFLAEAIPALLKNFTWPKSMRWPQGGDFRWVRPLRSILCILDGKRVKFSIAGLETSNQSEGETIASFENYKKTMKEKHILIDLKARQKKIREAIEKTAGLQLDSNNQLIKKLSALLEFPILMNLTQDTDSNDQLMLTSSLPPEIENSIYEKEYVFDPHQMGKSITFIEGKKSKYKKNIADGFRACLRARLKDAIFFIEQDNKTGLDALRKKLKDFSFHNQLGTMLDKAERLEKLACGKTLGYDEIIKSAAHHAKSDIASLSGKDFPEALGAIGAKLYAEAHPVSKNGAKIIEAIRTHYQPQGQNDQLPTKEGQIIALADKADMLAGFFSIGEMPTGSKDPFALRRAALGIIRIILGNKNFQTLDLNDLFAEALALYPSAGKDKNDVILTSLRRFMADRLKYHLRAQKQQADLVDAAMQAETGLNLARIHARLNALAAFLNTHNGAHLMTAWRRISGILKNAGAPPAELIHERLTEPAEKELARALNMKDYEKALADHDFTHAFHLLAQLREPVDAFFETVRVNVDDPETRQNRRALCAALRAIMNCAADFSSISGRT